MNPSHATALTGPAAERPVPFTLTPKALAALAARSDHPRVTVWRHVATLVAWLDAANPRTDHEIACRVMKLAEETGEAVAAYLGMTGQNPRKGTCATRDDLAAELCDVIITAMVALATITGNAADAETVLQAHLSARFARLLARIDQAPGDGEWACSCCDLASFGTEPDNGLCPDCASGRCGGCASADAAR
jgi:hypothetical protein